MEKENGFQTILYSRSFVLYPEDSQNIAIFRDHWMLLDGGVEMLAIFIELEFGFGMLFGESKADEDDDHQNHGNKL